MRQALANVKQRIDRLAKRLVPSEKAFLARIPTMSDVELEFHLVETTEQLIGPLAAFDSIDAIVGKYCAVLGKDPEVERAKFESALGPPMRRRWWFEEHRPHGFPRLVHEVAPGSDDRLFGRALLVDCPACAAADPGFCYKGGRVQTFVKLVPDWFMIGLPH